MSVAVVTERDLASRQANWSYTWSAIPTGTLLDALRNIPMPKQNPIESSGNVCIRFNRAS